MTLKMVFRAAKGEFKQAMVDVETPNGRPTT